MIAKRTSLIAAAAGLMACAGAALADSPSKATTTLDPTTSQRVTTKPAVLGLCPDPAPMFMEYGKGAVPYHPEMSVISLTGTVQNVGYGKFSPAAKPAAIELWVKWGGAAAQKVKTVDLATLAPGAQQTIQTAFDPVDYKQKLMTYGATPKLTLLLNINAAGPNGTKDCKMGEANIHWIYGPNAGELQAMGI